MEGKRATKVDAYVWVGWPESQAYCTEKGNMPKECEHGPDGSIFVPLALYNKKNNVRLVIIDKTYE